MSDAQKALKAVAETMQRFTWGEYEVALFGKVSTHVIQMEAENARLREVIKQAAHDLDTRKYHFQVVARRLYEALEED